MQTADKNNETKVKVNKETVNKSVLIHSTT